MRYTLGKDEKLKSKLFIKALFEEGKNVKSFPLRLIYLKKEHASSFPIKVGFSVPKRHVKLAVNRNRIKRQMREVYRKNKHLFTKDMQAEYLFMFVFMNSEAISSENLETALLKLQAKFSQKTQSNETN